MIFIWFGNSLPLACKIAVKSAVKLCDPSEVILVHEGLSMEDEGLHDLVHNHGVRSVPATKALFEGLPEGGEEAWLLFKSLTSPIPRSDILRMVLLWQFGGIYLDMDTITIKNLNPLRVYRGFCGCETIAVPGNLYAGRNPLRWIWSGVKVGARHLCRYFPKGFALFKIIEPMYKQGVNNAVIGSVAKNPFFEKAFLAVKEMPENARRKRYRLGPHLLQELTTNTTSEDMHVFDKTYFYPLGPEISVFWFRKNSADYVTEMISDQTHVVHWYGSVQQRFCKKSINVEYIKENPTSAFAALVNDYIDN